METFSIENLQKYSDQLIDYVLEFGPKILVALLLFVVGRWIIKKLTNVLSALMEKNNLDSSLKGFLSGLFSGVLNVLLFVSVVNHLGITTTSFVALIGAAGLAFGLALQGTLSNFAGGVLVLLFKPYKVGDLIDAQGHLGTVKEIQIFVTLILTPENKTVIIPNGAISNGNITNYTKEGLIRVDMAFGISYGSSIKESRKVLLEVMNAHKKIKTDPEPFVGVKELGDSSVNLAVRAYTAPQDYWEVYFDVMEAGKEALDKAQIVIPFPQMDVHIDK